MGGGVCNKSGGEGIGGQGRFGRNSKSKQSAGRVGETIIQYSRVSDKNSQMAMMWYNYKNYKINL